MAIQSLLPEERKQLLERSPWENAGRKEGLFRGTWHTLADVVRRRELLGMLTSRELKSRYKDSALGFVWSLARPLTLRYKPRNRIPRPSPNEEG